MRRRKISLRVGKAAFDRFSASVARLTMVE
jgi:hypothetical protein